MKKYKTSMETNHYNSPKRFAFDTDFMASDYTNSDGTEKTTNNDKSGMTNQPN